MVIFLHGDDTYRSRAKLHELEEKFRREVDPSGSNLTRIDGTSASASEIWGAIAAQSFLVRKRMVVVEDIGQRKTKTEREEVAVFLDRIPDDAIIVFWESKSRAPTSDHRKRVAAPKRKKKTATGGADPLFPLLLQGKYVEEFAPLEGGALERWVRARVESLGATIAPDALRMVMGEVGPNLWRMSSELEKLALAAEGATISVDLVRDLVAETPTDDVFAFVDAIGSGDRAAALRQLRRLEEAGAEPGALVGMIGRQLRLLVSASDLLARGTPHARLASELGVHPFVAQKIAEQAQHTSLPHLRVLYPHLLDLDRKLKSSRAPWEALMELFCLQATR